MIGKQIVLLYRPEAADHSPRKEHGVVPFDGIELAGIVDTDEEADKLIDRLMGTTTPLASAQWAFLIIPVPATLETVA